ncbi:uncharacterized protein BJ171DRAFT_583459 [Polychytrium aggregatum]|uniref:uncharacterized protein n=1 Tax=Polychytrium aggregatum TaxID=110093 RepID=UPI0022FDF6DB|nr:uncharacterized protein BJ171DRAFT_583459 [Polychytrium aggregatum]KAI9202977.1 hypothetical protein BJ171DRAFT_583459 [Polychytrium aggregatum]
MSLIHPLPLAPVAAGAHSAAILSIRATAALSCAALHTARSIQTRSLVSAYPGAIARLPSTAPISQPYSTPSMLHLSGPRLGPLLKPAALGLAAFHSSLSTAECHRDHHARPVPPFDPSKIDYQNVEGYVHSTESLGTLEGPGNRFLIFVTGCPARCLYCENPDTWEIKKAATVQKVHDLVERARKLQPFYKHSVGHGGVTISGGDPLDLGLHTCIETTGQGSHHAWDTVLPHTDLVLLCVKHTEPEQYHKITQLVRLERMLQFIKELERLNKPWWCRYVLVPGYTDKDKDIEGLIALCKSSTTLERIEILPYHTLGEYKWKASGMEYPMKGVPHPTKASLQAIVSRITSELGRPEIPVVTSA